MNYNAMTDRELLHYLDLNRNDPIVCRLVDMVDRLFADLEEEGMDPKTRTFSTDWGEQSVANYIYSLRTDVSEAESTINDLKYRLEEAVEERDRLKNRSIGDFLREVEQERINNREETYRVRKESQQLAEQNAKLKEQLDMWARMNQQERKLS